MKIKYKLIITFECDENEAVEIANSIADAARQDGLDSGAIFVEVSDLEPLE